MGTCTNHPDIETQTICMKYSKYLCGGCSKCQDPKLYCKFRSACTIWFTEKESRRLSKTG